MAFWRCIVDFALLQIYHQKKARTFVHKQQLTFITGMIIMSLITSKSSFFTSAWWEKFPCLQCLPIAWLNATSYIQCYLITYRYTYTQTYCCTITRLTLCTTKLDYYWFPFLCLFGKLCHIILYDNRRLVGGFSNWCLVLHYQACGWW